MLEGTVRVLVLDNNPFFARFLSEVLSELPLVEVVGSFAPGAQALAKLESLRPDILTLDFEMPEVDRNATLRKLKERGSRVSLIVFTSLPRDEAKAALKALDLGASVFLAKPKGENFAAGKNVLLSQLKPIINFFIVKKRLEQRRDLAGSQPSAPQREVDFAVRRLQEQLSGSKIPPPPAGLIQIVGIGISTGGPNALAQVIPFLPKELRVPVVIVQHMPSEFTRTLAASLDKKSRVAVVEGADNMVLGAGTVYVAPGGQQMKIVRQGQKLCLRVTDDPPENHCKPSADYLFRSMAELYGKRALGVIMTGMGSDGVLGLKALKEKGACILAQDESSCVVFGMPLEALNAGLVDVVSPLSEMAGEIVKRVN